MACDEDQTFHVVGGFMAEYRSEEWRNKISDGRKRHFEETLLPHAEEIPEQWHCARCGRMGRSAWQPTANFGIRKAKLKSGFTVTKPRSECRLCERERQEIRRQDPEKRKMDAARKLDWAKSEKGKRYYRDWGRMHRALNGTPIRGPWKIYEHEVNEKLPFVPAKPFVEWFLGLNGSRPSESRMGDSLTRSVRRAIYGGEGSASSLDDRTIRLDTVDAVAVLAGEPDLIMRLYPHT
jgi:hypothetical protein